MQGREARGPGLGTPDIEHSKLNKMGFKYVYSSSYKSARRRGVAILISSAVNYEHVSGFKDKGIFVMTIGNKGCMTWKLG